MAIFAHESVHCTMENIPIPMAEEKTFECCACLCKTPVNNFVLVTIYRSPSSDFDSFISKLDNILDILYDTNRTLVLCGDFNCDFLSHSVHKVDLCNIFDSYGLNCLISQPTRVTASSKSLLDNFVTNFNPQHTVSSVYDVGLSDHFMIETIFRLNHCLPHPNLYKRIISQSNVDSFKNLLSHECWEDVFSVDSFDVGFDNFYQKFCFLYDLAFPVISFTSKRKNHIKKPWLTSEIIALSRITKQKSLYCKLPIQ